MNRLLMVGAAMLALVPVAATAANAPKADLAIVSNTASARHARVGQQVTFMIVATNNGPDAAELDVQVALRGLILVKQTCDLGISADTPSCEYGIVQPGQALTTTVVAQVVRTGARTATSTACVTSASPVNDPKTGNDCVTAALKVVRQR